MSAIRTIFGSMDIARRVTLKEGQKMLNIYSKYGYNEVDTAFMYGDGQTEVYLGDMKDFVDQNLTYATKANPWDGKGLGAASLRNQLQTSLSNLKRDRVDIFYLHAPDHETPLQETLDAAQMLYQEGKFLELGLSNYSSWLVAEVVNICKRNGYIIPTVYEGMYSALTRMVEKELIPCLRYHGMRFYAFSPLAGGFLTGKHKMGDENNTTEPGRFFGPSSWNTLYRDRYWKRAYFEAVAEITQSLNKVYGDGNVSIAEAAYRWLYHHSALNGKLGDGVIVGASSSKQLDQNLSYTMLGPLDTDVVTTINCIWEKTSHLCPDFAR